MEGLLIALGGIFVVLVLFLAVRKKGGKGRPDKINDNIDPR